jgi:putative SbcD/Mre11-related phosphoesterase
MHFLEKQGVECHEQFIEIGDNFITHGHIDLSEEIAISKTKRVIIGHEHPGIMVRDELMSGEKFKAFVKTKIFNKDLFVLPAFSPLKPGTELNVKNIKFLSPILDRSDLDNFIFYVNEDKEWFSFNLFDIIDR